MLGRREAPETAFEEHRDGQQDAHHKEHRVGPEEAARLNINPKTHAVFLRPAESYVNCTIGIPQHKKGGLEVPPPLRSPTTVQGSLLPAFLAPNRRLPKRRVFHNAGKVSRKSSTPTMT